MILMTNIKITNHHLKPKTKNAYQKVGSHKDIKLNPRENAD